LLSFHARAEFYIWFDELGYKHVSMVPRECITEHKTVRQDCLHYAGTGEYVQPPPPTAEQFAERERVQRAERRAEAAKLAARERKKARREYEEQTAELNARALEKVD
jgi:hypothetical protein